MNNDQPKMHFVPKSWGWEKWIVNKKEYCGKLLNIAKDQGFPAHYHKLKDETFYISTGKVKLYYSDNLSLLAFAVAGSAIPILDYLDSIILSPGDNFYIPPGRVHQIVALEDSEMFEFSTQHFDDDSYRINP